MPMKNEPITLMIRMLNGKFVPNITEIWFPRIYRNTAPSAPPSAIAIMLSKPIKVSVREKNHEVDRVLDD